MDDDRPVIRADTIVEAFLDRVKEAPDDPAMRRRDAAGDWETLTWADYGRAVAEILGGMAELGIGPGEHVGILSTNRVEWHLADLATMAGGGVTVPVYQTSYAPQVQYVLGHGEARLCFVEDEEQLGKIFDVRDELPKLDHVVVFDPEYRSTNHFVLTIGDLRALGTTRLAKEPDLLETRAAAVTPDTLATLVYTSGTTGPPKGTMINHGNIIWTLRNAPQRFEVRRGERLLSFLPLSHIAERMMSDFLPIAYGGETWFARSLATVVEDLPDCRPTVFFAVPRVWEKLHEKVAEKLGEERGLKRRVIDLYLAAGHRRVDAEQAGTPVPAMTARTWNVLDRAVGAKVRSTLGLDAAHVMITAAAPIHPDQIRWFHAIGLPVYELYGQTEDCGPTSTNYPGHNRIGTVGPPIPRVVVRIADDSEILVKGGNVCVGYWHDRAATRALIDADGFMHSGDLGALDADGYLTITGRKKDLIITAAGKNITPQEIETDIRNHELVSQAVVVGEGRRYLTALVTLDGEILAAWAKQHGKLLDEEALTRDPDVLVEVQAAIDDANGKRSHAESVRKFAVLPHDLTIGRGELTPTLKVKRNVVYERYAELIESMYAEEMA
jgi:long-chain acyl-CoA synthetase